ncbi:MAG TPA: YncE family protein [Gemmatimonadales bacterium]|nr:YncE family protein [Gemmatimonadales bacterium]
MRPLRRLLVAGALLGAPATLAAQQGPRMYVTNQDDATISVIDPATNRVETTIDLRKLGYPASAKPHHTQVEPGGGHWYATLIGAGKVLKFDRDNRVVDSASLEVPGLMAIHPTKDLLVVARSMSAVNPPRRLALIRRSDMKVLDEVDVFFPRPHAIAANGDYAYVASLGVNQMASVQLDSGTVQLVDVDGPQHTLTQFALSPDHRWLVATGSTSGRLLVFSLADPATPAFAREVEVEAGPFESAFTADGRQLVVTNLDANAVTFLDTATWTVQAVVKDSALRQPHGVAFGPDGRTVYVSNRHQAGGIHDHEGHQATGGGNVVAICVPTRAVDAVMPVGKYAAGISGVPPTPDARGTVEPTTCR